MTLRRYSLLAAAIVLAGCASQPPPQIVKVEEPPPKQKEIVIPPDPMDGLSPDERAAILNHATPTLHDGIATLFPYTPNQQWTIYCSPLTATEIRLNSDEWTDKDSVVLGDSVRWAIKIGSQAVMVEPLGTPADPHMMTNLIIHTNKRSYHLQLRMRANPMAAIAWYYPDDVRHQQAARQIAQRQAAAQAAADPPAAPKQQEVH